MITGPQLRAARGLLDWTRGDLAKAAKISSETVKNIEHGTFRPQEGTTQRIIETFGQHDVEFTPDQGVRVRRDIVTQYEGVERFQEFYDFLYEHLKQFGGEVCLSVADEKLLAKYRKDPEVQRHRMKELVENGKITYRVLVTESDFTGDYVEYRQQPKQAAAPTAFYAFGECLALITFTHKTPPYVIVIKSEPLTQTYRQAFHAAWNNAKPLNKVKR